MTAAPTRLYIEQAATYLDKPVYTLRRWRLRGVGPRSYIVREGLQDRLVYDVADLDAFKATQGQQPSDVRGNVSAAAI